MLRVSAPPPDRIEPDELEALIREARARQRRRRIGAASVLAIVSALGLALWAVAPLNSSGSRDSEASGGTLVHPDRCTPGNLGTVAFVHGGALRLLDLNGCRVRTLVRSHVTAPIAMSPSGRWVAYPGGYVSLRDGRVHRLPGTVVWSSRRDLFAVVTKRGGLEVGRAGRRLHRFLPDGWGVWTAAFSPSGRLLAVSRTAGRGRIEQIWLLDLTTGARLRLYREPRREGAPPLLEGFSPDGEWLLFWKDLDASASLLADGVPLLAVPVAGGRARTVARGELYDRDFLSWCRDSLVYVTDRGGRMVTQGDGIARAAPPSWRSRSILPSAGPTSWTSFSCSPEGTLAVAAGPSSDGEPFGHEHRSVWLVRGKSASVVAVTRPPRGTSDEWPSWSADGKWLLFVRTRWNGHGWPGSLYAVDLATEKLIGPIARVGATSNYYGHYGWPSQLSWHRP